jgi:cell division protein FtsB
MPSNDKNSRFPYIISFILLLLLINSVRSIYDMHKSIGRLDQAEFQLNALKIENEKLKGDIAYAQTPEYLQKAAVEELNMAKPGETILLVEQLHPKEEKVEIPGNSDNITTPKPLELWATQFNLQDRYFSWHNRNM